MERLYPEVRAGGFTRVDGTVEFYQRVRALLAPGMTVLDFGAGRGAFLDDAIAFRRDLRDLRGLAGEVIGVDVDAAVEGNRSLDRALVVAEGEPMPLPDASVDVVVSDFTFEHVADPAAAARELDRVLRAGGWICARTPNRHGYIGIGARLVPNRLHAHALRRLQPTKRHEDTFPTHYRLNTRKAIEEHFPPTRYEHVVYAMDNEPSYVGSSWLAWRVAHAAFRLTPERFRSMLYVFLRKLPA